MPRISTTFTPPFFIAVHMQDHPLISSEQLMVCTDQHEQRKNLGTPTTNIVYHQDQSPFIPCTSSKQQEASPDSLVTTTDQFEGNDSHCHSP